MTPEDHAKRIAHVNIQITASRTLLGANVDMFSALALVGNAADAERARADAHAHLDAMLDAHSALAHLARSQANLS